MSDLSFGDRLKSERERLGLSQTAFGEACGVKKLAQLHYEKGDRNPDIVYLEKASGLGVDLYYLLTGFRIGRTIGELKQLPAYQEALGEPMTAQNADEQELLKRFRQASAETRAFIMKGLEL